MGDGRRWWLPSGRTRRGLLQYPGGPPPRQAPYQLPFNEGLPAEGYHYNHLDYVPHEPYRVGPASFQGRQAADVFPEYHAPPHHRPAEVFDRPLPYVYPPGPAPVPPRRPDTSPWRSHHYPLSTAQAPPPVQAPPSAAPARSIHAAPAAPVQAAKTAPVQAPPPAAPVRSKPVAPAAPLQAAKTAPVQAPPPAVPVRPIPPVPAAPLQAAMPAAAPKRQEVAGPATGGKAKSERWSKWHRSREHSLMTGADTAKRKRHRRHSGGGTRSLSGIESDARTSAGASPADTRNATGMATSTAATRGRTTTTGGRTTSSGTSSSSSSSSSETARVVRMMKTCNLPRPPPDNWQPGLKLVVTTLLSGTTFALVMVLAYLLETTVLLPWETVGPNPVTNPKHNGNETLMITKENSTNYEALNANSTDSTGPMNLQDQYDEKSFREEHLE